MSLKLMHECLEHARIEGRPRTVLMMVAFYAEQSTALAWPSNTELARWGISERWVQTALRQLERAGHLRRQPALEDGRRRRRVYLVDPRAELQLNLLERAHQVHPAHTSPAENEGPGRTIARVGKEPQGTTTKPPQPPRTGGELHGGAVLESSDLESPSPRATAETVRVTSARRRRNRRRERPDRPPVTPPGQCPLNGGADSAAADLLDGWRELNQRVRQRVDGPGWEQWEIWTVGAHLHQLEPEIKLALAPHLRSMFEPRWRRLLDQLAPVPIVLVECAIAGPERLPA